MKLTKFIKITKWHFLLLLVVCSIAVFLPLDWAEAGLGTIIIDAIKGMVLSAITVTMLVLASISLGLFKLSEVILIWASNPELLGSVTKSEFVMTAWETVRDFSNMFLLLILVVIGISTALRIKEYEIQKTIPRLIGVAILINFSPVICGVVIDTANIFINFFLTAGGAGFNNTINLSSTIGNHFQNSLTHALGNWAELVNGVLFLNVLGVFLFNLVGAMVFALFTILFLIRNIALWMLVILSPLAFLSFVLPVTKKAVFDRWRKEFIQWCFIGVTGAFFIYLTQLMLSLETSQMLKNAPPIEGTGFGSAELGQMVVMSIPILFLLMGFFITMSTSAAGAKGVISTVQKGASRVNPMTKQGRATLNRLRKGVGGATALGAAGAGKIPGVKKRAQRIIAKTPEDRKGAWEKSSGIGKAGKVAARIAMPYWARKQVAAAIVKPGEEKIRKKTEKIKEAKKETDKIETDIGLRTEYKKGDTKTQIAAMQTAAEKGSIDIFSPEEIANAIQKANKINKKLAQEIMQSAPNVAQALYEEGERELVKNHDEWEEAKTPKEKNRLDKQYHRKQQELEKSGLWLDEQDKSRYGSLEAKIVLTMASKDIGKISKNYVTNKDHDPNNKFMEIVQDIEHEGRSAWGGNKLIKMAEEHGTPAVERYNKLTDKIGEEGFEKNRASKWITNSPGAYAPGYRPPKAKKKEGEGEEKGEEGQEEGEENKEEKEKERRKEKGGAGGGIA